MAQKYSFGSNRKLSSVIRKARKKDAGKKVKRAGRKRQAESELLE